MYVFVTKLMNNLFGPHKLVANGWKTEMWSCRLFFFFAQGFQWYLLSFGTLKRLPVQEGCWEAGRDLARGYQDSKRPKTGVLWGVIVETGLVLCNEKETEKLYHTGCSLWGSGCKLGKNLSTRSTVQSPWNLHPSPSTAAIKPWLVKAVVDIIWCWWQSCSKQGLD